MSASRGMAYGPASQRSIQIYRNKLEDFPLPVQLQRELKLPRVVRGGRLPGKARGAGCRIAQLVDGANVRAIKKIEAVGDEIKIETFTERDALGDTEIDLEKAWRDKRIAAEIAIATRGWRDAGHGERLTPIGQAGGGKREGNAREKW